MDITLLEIRLVSIRFLLLLYLLSTQTLSSLRIISEHSSLEMKLRLLSRCTELLRELDIFPLFRDIRERFGIELPARKALLFMIGAMYLELVE
jgi:hypothetical protein